MELIYNVSAQSNKVCLSSRRVSILSELLILLFKSVEKRCLIIGQSVNICLGVRSSSHLHFINRQYFVFRLFNLSFKDIDIMFLKYRIGLFLSWKRQNFM